MFGFDKKTLYIILGGILLFSMFNGAIDIASLIYTLPAVIIAMTFHEFAHAYAADKLGDSTPRSQGRLNLNPLSHIDPIGLVFLVVAHFGWGKPVQIDSRNFNGKYSVQKSEAIVAAAGPISNFILAFIFTIIFYSIMTFGNLSSQWTKILANLSYITVIINLGLGIFNLIPVSPLDGSKILMNFLSYDAKQWFYRNQMLLTLATIVIVFSTNIMSYAVQYASLGMNWLVGNIFGLFM